MKLFHNHMVRLLSARLRDERRARVKAEAERDEYRKLYLDKVEYIALMQGMGRFNVTKEEENEGMRIPAAKTFAEMDREWAEEDAESFRRFLESDPEEMKRLGQQ